MKDENKGKHRKFLFSLLICLFVVCAGFSGYAAATGQMPAFLQAMTGLFNPSSAGNVGKAHTTQLEVTSTPKESAGAPEKSGINPDEINPSDSIAHDTSSSSSSAPDAKGDQSSDIHGSDSTVKPMPITVSRGTASSKPTGSSPSSQNSSGFRPAPVSSSPASSVPNQPASSSPTSSVPGQTIPVRPNPGHSDSGGHSSRPITGITLDQDTITLNKGGVSAPLITTIVPANTTGNKTITWKTDNPAIVTVDQSGKVTAVGAGKTEVNATTANGKTVSCTVTVLVPPDGIKINSDNFSLDKGAVRTLTATLTPEDCTNKQVMWATSNNDVISIEPDGKVTGVGPGKAIITATTEDQKHTATCEATVVISISSLTLDQTELNMIKGTQTTLVATISPPSTTEKPNVEWTSSNPAAATVDSSGLISAVEGGETTITAQVGSHVAECKVTVIVPATGVAVNKSAVTLAKGTEETLIATVFPEDTSDNAVLWTSSDGSVATVDSSGKVAAVSPGTAVITATTHDGGFTSSCTVTVVIPVTGITLNKSELHLMKGSGDTLAATITPADATDQALTWTSSDASVATVDSAGHIIAVGGGTATVTVTTHDGGFSASCNVTVTVPVTGISIDKNKLTLIKGTSEKLIATIMPADASNKAVTWNSSAPNICSVDNAGRITALQPGTAVISVVSADGGYHAECSVTIVIPVTGVKLNQTSMHLNRGDTNRLITMITPTDATDQVVNWFSSNPAVVTVDGGGNLSAIGAGTAAIRVTTHDGGFSADCAITVTVPVTGISLNTTALNLDKGTGNTLTATIYPYDATDNAVIWNTSDPTVCSVDSSGNIYGLNTGTAVITAISQDGGFTAQCTVSVTELVVDITGEGKHYVASGAYGYQTYKQATADKVAKGLGLSVDCYDYGNHDCVLQSDLNIKLDTPLYCDTNTPVLEGINWDYGDTTYGNCYSEISVKTSDGNSITIVSLSSATGIEEVPESLYLPQAATVTDIHVTTHLNTEARGSYTYTSFNGTITKICGRNAANARINSAAYNYDVPAPW